VRVRVRVRVRVLTASIAAVSCCPSIKDPRRNPTRATRRQGRGRRGGGGVRHRASRAAGPPAPARGDPCVHRAL